DGAQSERSCSTPFTSFWNGALKRAPCTARRRSRRSWTRRRWIASEPFDRGPEARDERFDLCPTAGVEPALPERATELREDRRESVIGATEERAHAARRPARGDAPDEARGVGEARVDRCREHRIDRGGCAERRGARGVEPARDRRRPGEAGAGI